MKLSEIAPRQAAITITRDDLKATQALVRELQAFQRKLAPLRGVRLLKGSNVWHFLDSAEKYAQQSLQEIEALLKEQQ